ncbi:sensor histidine kinase [Cohaesibacter intestini]|uniref:sensor histidine kinase n=1 Tax=Cohaesibacter intestini TaxID=2211145 RepID=UPI000DE899AB|nr:sensor histidine kinase [Cohaesibacter intestini]
MIHFSDLTEDQRALVQDPARLSIAHQITGSGIIPDTDFDTLIELIRVQNGADKAFIALVGATTVSYQAFAKTKDCEINLADGRDMIAVACLKKQAGWQPPFLVSETQPFQVWGEPITVAAHAIGCLCLVFPVDASGPDDEQLMRSTLLVASLYEMKKSARTRVMEKFDLSRSNIRYALALKAGQVATWSWDKGEQVVECDASMRELMGIKDVGTITTRSFLQHIDRNDLARLKEEASKIDATKEDLIFEFRARYTNNYIMVMGHLFERDEDGLPKKVLGVAIDLTESKRNEAKTRLLLREVNHRVKNMLAILQSLASQSLRNTQSPEHFTRAFSGRLAALATSHSLLSDQEWDDIDLVSLIKTQVKPYASHYAEQVSIEGQPIAINADAAIALGLVMHELATNAMQFGALSLRDGRLEICLSAQCLPSGEQAATILWKESGGPVVREDRRNGFGSVLIEHSLNKVVGSHVDIAYPSSGFEAKITLPI